MSDRDIPSVPVTTLAGLTSLSDLLSELPVSDSLSSVTSLNKSLLFHTLVADESNNLLSVRDDNLVKQLVHAIEQTNSDNIEVKSQYAITQHGTNISTYPELLQGIYTFRPTVFNTPQNHRIQNHQSSSQPQHHLQQQQVHVQQQYVPQAQTAHTSSQIQQQQQQRIGVNVIQNLPDQSNATNVLQHQQQQIKPPVINNITVQQFMAVPSPDGKLQQQPQILQQVIINPTPVATQSPVQNNFVANATTYQQQLPQSTVETPVRRTRRSAAAAAVEQQQQVTPPQVLSPKQQTSTSPQQNIVAYQKKQAAVLLQQQQQQQQLLQQQQLQQQELQQQQQQLLQQQQKQPVSQQTSVIQPHTPVIQQQQHQPVIQQNHQQKTVILPTPPQPSVIIQQQPSANVINAPTVVQQVAQSQQVQHTTTPQIQPQQQKQYPQVPQQPLTQKQQTNTQKVVHSQQQQVLTPNQPLQTKQQTPPHKQQNPQISQQQQSQQVVQQPPQQLQPNKQQLKQVPQQHTQPLAPQQHSQVAQQQQVNTQQKQQQLQHLQKQKQQQSPQSPAPQQQNLSQQQPQQAQQVPHVIQGQFQNVLNLQRQHFAQQQQKQQSTTPQKTTPRNSEYLQQQSKNFELRGKSPAQASTAPDSNQIGQNPQQQKESTTVSNNNNGSMKNIATTMSNTTPTTTTPVVLPTNATSTKTTSSEIVATSTTSSSTTTTLPARSNSVNSSASNASRSTTNSKSRLRSPELAVKIGLADEKKSSSSDPAPSLPPSSNSLKEDKEENKMPAPTPTQTNANSSGGAAVGDTFSMMKAADDKRIATKRKLAIKPDDEIPPEQIFSQPKVRRVERNVAPSTPKCSKEEVMRSQTYQQFMKNMEQIIEQLDDTEQPNFDSDEIDQNIECITSKMLNVMSNDVAKLKAKMVLDSIPKNKLTLLINYAMRNVYLAKNYSAGPDDEDDIIDDEIMDKILNAIEACLLVCNIYSTAKDLKFLQEDNISLIIKFIQFQFRETIFPSYDPVYTVKSMKKMDNRKKTKAQLNHNRSLQLLYSKSVELMKVFVTLFDKCIFVDTIVLPLSTLAIEPFFVDNIDTLQFVCLELVTTIFRKEKYDKMRSSILGDILASIDRLPSSKKNLRPFKLSNNGGNIQMVTALVLQLIQCATILPDSIYEPLKNSKKSRSVIIVDPEEAEKPEKDNKDVLVLKKYDVAVSIGGNFLTTFLNKCKTRSNETDFRPLFENFIHDLLATVNKPEWPASELLLSLLGTLLVKYVSDKTIEQSIRLVSLDYLGIVAARLRKDTVESRCKVNIIDSMIKCIKAEQEKEGDLPIVNSKIELDPEEERTEFLQKILLDFLAVNAQEEDLVWDYARHFYLAQWYRDIIYQRRRIADGEKGYASRKKKTAKKKRRKGESSESSSDSESSNADDDSENGANGSTGGRNNKSRTNNDSKNTTDQELNLEIFNVLEERKKYLLSKIKPYTDMNCTSQHIKTYIDYNNAHLIAQYLASKRPFSQSFDKYLQKIILVVNEPSIAVRTRAMKCLANIVEVDPMVLKRKDMQMGVNQKFLDAAISVREAAVDLVGKFVLSNEELIDQYYDMLSTRILDTGVSVRKRVIKILRDICIEYPDFEKIPEICVKMIRRVNDEEGIQKLVTEVFMKMWFMPCKDNDKHGIQRKINQIIDVVNTAHDTGTTWLEGLLVSIFAPKENMLKPDGSAQEAVKKNTEPAPEIVLACQQLADGLVERLIELEDTDNARMLGCITTLHLLAKVRPQLLVRHAITIEPYLNIKCHSAIAPKFICSVADILEQVVPLIVNPSESFLASLEEHLMLLVVSLNQAVVTSCVSCLGALVNKITKNYKLIRDCFQKFYRIIENSRDQVAKNNYSIDSIYTPIFRRSLFTIGILMRYFDFKSPKVLGEGSGFSPQICDEVFECLMFFTQCANNDIRKQALIALGSFCVMNDDYLTRNELKKFYCDLLQSENIDACIKIICMRNIWIYLTESEIYMHNKEKDWEKQQQTEDLKEMNDVSSGMASRIIQLYLQDILDCFLNRDDSVRLWAVKVVQIVLRQGLVHPVRMVPYLITLSTDSKQESAHRADALLKEIDKTYSGFVNMKVQFGLQLCFKLQELLQGDRGKNVVIRGFSKKEHDVVPTALNDFLYTLLRTTKPQRRALVQTVTKQFDDQKTTLRQMLYIADNLAYFPYVVQDEPLYLIHQIDLMISMAGTNLLATFKECLKPAENADDILEDDDDEEDPDVLFKRLPEDISEIRKCITSAQACMLLLILKQHLKDMYGLTDGKISRYSPSETQKIYEKAVTRKTVPDFNPKSTIEEIKKSVIKTNDVDLNPEDKRDLVVKYLDFKQLMLKLDPDDADSLDDERDKSKLNNTAASIDTPSTPALNSTGANQSSMDDQAGESSSGARTGSATTPHVNSVNHTTVSTPAQSKQEIPATPTTRTARATKSSSRKQPTRSKRKKRKIVSSDDDEDDYSDADYA
ncbi:nipped-B protein isoform X3 [Episyrphus balteatus]|uniref:nipped-B protein isoform X3 n=1 Tax=Episyrphus balteatus TaxID=286459 RepID=UPI0024861F39|nr:nipped-B protein isoform X3 [Episyrphus balteatus]